MVPAGQSPTIETSGTKKGDEMVAAKSAIGSEEVKLPPLLVNITRNGEVVRTVEIPDPREAYCRAYPEWDSECTAVPA